MSVWNLRANVSYSFVSVWHPLIELQYNAELAFPRSHVYDVHISHKLHEQFSNAV